MHHAQSEHLLQRYQAILNAELRDASTADTAIMLSGLVATVNGKRQVKNRIYREVFNPAWLGQQLNLNQVDLSATVSREIEQLLAKKCDRAKWLQEAILEKLEREGDLPSV